MYLRHLKNGRKVVKSKTKFKMFHSHYSNYIKHSCISVSHHCKYHFQTFFKLYQVIHSLSENYTYIHVFNFQTILIYERDLLH